MFIFSVSQEHGVIQDRESFERRRLGRFNRRKGLLSQSNWSFRSHQNEGDS